MRIVVCLKQVPDPMTVEVDPITGAIDHSRLLYMLNPADAAALEIALQLRGDTGTILALAVGPPQAEAVLREALAVGVDRVLRLWDAICSETNPFLTARLLAAALQIEGLPDVILCGARSVDRGSGHVPALLGEYLGWPVVTDITQLGVQPAVARVQRRLERGAREEGEVTLPTVLSFDVGIARLRHASLPGLMSAQRAAIPVRTPADLVLTAADLHAPTVIRQAELPPRPRVHTMFIPDSTLPPHERVSQILSAGVTRKSGKMLEGPPDQMAAAIIAFLRERGFLEDSAACLVDNDLVSRECG
ncbi:MAG: electron transfer flavoprotein subunit beta/FixA family protein [Chloroflexales bacterium]|nr:electron transfer flavoprotein subunit beta/FixA family protein [Chloroflexales bacterium]